MAEECGVQVHEKNAKHKLVGSNANQNTWLYWLASASKIVYSKSASTFARNASIQRQSIPEKILAIEDISLASVKSFFGAV